MTTIGLDDLGTSTTLESNKSLLCMEGYCDIFEGNLSPQKQGNIIAPKGTIDYCRQVVDARSNDFKKPKAAVTVIEEMEKRGPAGVPTQIQQIIELVLKLAAEVA